MTRKPPPNPRAEAGRIRRGRHGDADAILALEAHFPTDRMARASVRRFLRVPSSHVWIAELDGAVVGALIWLTRRGSAAGRIYSVVVDPAARGRRFGARLVQAMEREAAGLGCTRATLEVREDNAAARALYAKLGYTVQRALPDYYEDGGNGLKLGKPLRAPRPRAGY